MSTTAPAVVKSTTTAEVIALLPSLAGLSPQNSLIVAPFEGKIATRAMRIGVEADPGDDSLRRLASTVLAGLTRMDAADSVVVAVYRDEPFVEVAPGWKAGLDLLTERLHSAGYHIEDAAIVAADGWMPYFDGATGAPHPLAELERGARRIPDDHGFIDPAIMSLPAQDAELAERVTQLYLGRADLGAETDAFGLLLPAEPPNPVDALEQAICREPTEANAQTLAHLLAQIDSEGAVDRTVLQIAFGRDVASLSWARTLWLRGEAAEAGCAPIDLMARDADPQTQRLTDLMSGQTREAPDADRLQVGAVLLGRAVAHCGVPDRSWALCALAWLRWALGLTRSAFTALDAARRIDPDNPLPPVLFAMFETTTPDWLSSPVADRRSRRTRARRKK